MTILKTEIIGNPDEFTKVGSRLYRMESDGCIVLYTTSGVVRFYWKKGFITDGRSGGVFVDPIFPNWGTKEEKACVLMHDIGFHDFDISFETLNLWLRDMILRIGYSTFRAGLVYKGVSTGIARRAFGCKTDAEWANRKLCDCRWDPK